MYDHATALQATITKHDVRQQDAPLPGTGNSVRRVSYMDRMLPLFNFSKRVMHVPWRDLHLYVQTSTYTHHCQHAYRASMRRGHLRQPACAG